MIHEGDLSGRNRNTHNKEEKGKGNLGWLMAITMQEGTQDKTNVKTTQTNETLARLFFSDLL